MPLLLYILFLCCIYSSFEQQSPNTPASLNDLEALVKKELGVYNKTGSDSVYDGTIQTRLDKTVMVTAANFAYLSHLMNFKCFTDRLNIHFLVISLDERIHKHITSMGMTSYYFHEHEGKVSERAAVFRDTQFNLISNLKIKSVQMILQLGYDVLFSDPDIAIVNNPIPLMFSFPYDHVFSTQSIHPCEQPKDMTLKEAQGNTGFYLMRSTAATIDLMRTVISAVAHYPKLDDQAIFWNLYHERQLLKWPLYRGQCGNQSYPLSLNGSVVADTGGGDSSAVTSCHLDQCQFSAGRLQRRDKYLGLLNSLQAFNSTMFTVHANMIKGEHLKAQMMKANGLWLHSGPPSGKQCAPFKDTTRGNGT